MLSEEQGQALVRLARQEIEARLGLRPAAAAGEDPVLGERRGVFVTLHRNRELRGCIGSLAAVEPLAEGVRRNAINAAFHDYRFTPLTAAELPELHIEVSVLSEPQPLITADADDLVSSNCILAMLETTAMLAEGAGAASLAGLHRRRYDFAGRKVGIVLSGGNLTLERLGEALTKERAW